MKKKLIKQLKILIIDVTVIKKHLIYSVTR